MPYYSYRVAAILVGSLTRRNVVQACRVILGSLRYSCTSMYAAACASLALRLLLIPNCLKLYNSFISLRLRLSNPRHQVLQALLVVLALKITVLRCWIRLRLEHRKLTLPDYFVWAGWFFTLGWFICSAVTLNLQVDHPLLPENDFKTDSVSYLVAVFIASYCFDIGLYFPKAAILSFYWWLIPRGFRRLRIALWAGIVYTACACITAFLVDTCVSRPISNNWSIENQELSLWNSVEAVVVNWSLNFTTDLLVFILPFFIISCLQLRKRQKFALCGIFSLGLITIVLSLTRFIVFQVSTELVDDASGNLWYTAEMATATIVVSLPALKPLIMKATPQNTSNRGISGYVQSGPRRSFNQPSFHGRMGGSSRACVEAGGVGDDEIQLVLQDSRKNSMSPTDRTISDVGTHDGKDTVKITTDVTILREAL
ncbi:hypothetical protein HBI25_157810 [Parastagonospora nodorum]|nr:hypothetical protein HBH46_144550 [Parastagonospora nodorum]KAH4216464.1 hypothetical protein HBI06_230420 [Parastagonospora nodorum]KAH4226232.1 hypothetical protein HBI05_221970 [Parastagonospora nodorum]KAH4903143.1 hypothetical protein HBH74_182740 [Parastagonospora nodorum]KAH4945833.1 hypothetical protein HBH73_144880 [Parastagonospora nodorum]